MTALALFVATFVLVFALGLQSLNVNKGQYAWAFFTSLVIGSMQMVMLKLGPDASWLEIAGYLTGGPFGIVAAMRVQPWLTRSHPERRLRSRSLSAKTTEPVIPQPQPRYRGTGPAKPDHRIIFHGAKKP